MTYTKEQLDNCQIFAKLYIQLLDMPYDMFNGADNMSAIIQDEESTEEEKKMALYTLAEVFYGKDGLADD